MSFATAQTADQEIARHEIAGFPLNRGVTVPASFWTAHQTTIQDITRRCADTTVRIELWGTYDATLYHDRNFEDVHEAALAYSRCLAVTNQLHSAGIPRERIRILNGRPEPDKGPQYRKVIIRLVQEIIPPVAPARIDTVVARYDTVLQPIVMPAEYGLWLGFGGTNNASGKIVPILRGEVGNRHWRVLAEVSHSLYTKQYAAGTAPLRVNYRLIHCGLALRPRVDWRLEFLGGWQRTEEYSTRYGRYVHKFEGAELGARYLAFKHVSLTLLWSPSELSTWNDPRVSWNTDQARVSVAYTFAVMGGGR